MKLLFCVLNLLTLSINAFAADSIKDVAQNILSCHESLTGSDVQLKVETTYTQISFNDSGSRTYPTKRVIELTIRNETASSVISTPQIPANISWDDLAKFPFLTDDFVAQDGSAYQLQSSLYDQQHQAYPAQLLRLKAVLPHGAKGDSAGQTTTHYSVNLVLPESEVRGKRSFEASGYLNYNLKENPNTDFTIGLSVFACTETNLKINP